MLPQLPRIRLRLLHLFQQDNAPPHVSAATRAFLQAHRVEVLKWPPNSPDLSPIENVWSVLKHNVYKRNFRDSDTLWEVIQEEWARLDYQIVRNLISSMPHRIENVLKRHGGPSGY